MEPVTFYTSLSARVIPTIRSLRQKEQSPSNQVIYARLETVRLMFFTLGDLSLHAIGMGDKFMTCIKRLDPQLLKEVGCHAWRVMRCVMALFLTTLAAVVRPEWAIHSYEWLSLLPPKVERHLPLVAGKMALLMIGFLYALSFKASHQQETQSCHCPQLEPMTVIQTARSTLLLTALAGCVTGATLSNWIYQRATTVTEVGDDVEEDRQRRKSEEFIKITKALKQQLTEEESFSRLSEGPT